MKTFKIKSSYLFAILWIVVISFINLQSFDESNFLSVASNHDAGDSMNILKNGNDKAINIPKVSDGFIGIYSKENENLKNYEYSGRAEFMSKGNCLLKVQIFKNIKNGYPKILLSHKSFLSHMYFSLDEATEQEIYKILS